MKLVFFLLAAVFCGVFADNGNIEPRNMIDDGIDIGKKATQDGTDLAKDSIDKGSEIAHDALDKAKDITHEIANWLNKNVGHHVGDFVNNAADKGFDAGKAGIDFGSKVGKGGADLGNKVTQNILDGWKDGIKIGKDFVNSWGKNPAKKE